MFQEKWPFQIMLHQLRKSFLWIENSTTHRFYFRCLDGDGEQCRVLAPVTRHESDIGWWPVWPGSSGDWARCRVSDQIWLPPPLTLASVRCSQSHYGENLCIKCHGETRKNIVIQSEK